jgi:hypothetical protein
MKTILLIGAKMRMWMVNPRQMCRKHLLGEHVELHMFMGTIKKRKNLDGYVKNNLLDFMSIPKRHSELVSEMIRRGYHHQSKLIDLEKKDIEYYNHQVVLSEVDRQESRLELARRCEKCKERYKDGKTNNV